MTRTAPFRRDETSPRHKTERYKTNQTRHIRRALAEVVGTTNEATAEVEDEATEEEGDDASSSPDTAGVAAVAAPPLSPPPPPPPPPTPPLLLPPARWEACRLLLIALRAIARRAPAPAPADAPLWCVATRGSLPSFHALSGTCDGGYWRLARRGSRGPATAVAEAPLPRHTPHATHHPRPRRTCPPTTL